MRQQMEMSWWLSKCFYQFLRCIDGWVSASESDGTSIRTHLIPLQTKTYTWIQWKEKFTIEYQLRCWSAITSGY